MKKEIGKIGKRTLCGTSALRGVAASIRPQKAAEVGLLLEKDQDFMASLICYRRGWPNTEGVIFGKRTAVVFSVLFTFITCFSSVLCLIAV